MGLTARLKKYIYKYHYSNFCRNLDVWSRNLTFEHLKIKFSCIYRGLKYAGKTVFTKLSSVNFTLALGPHNNNNRHFVNYFLGPWKMDISNENYLEFLRPILYLLTTWYRWESETNSGKEVWCLNQNSVPLLHSRHRSYPPVQKVLFYTLVAQTSLV